jgi:hypothetical protein
MLDTLDTQRSVGVAASPREQRLMHARAVSDTLRGYAERGAFRSFSDGTMRSAKVTYRMLWHYDRTYRLILDLEAQSLAIPDMLPGVPTKAPMVGELRAFLKPFGTEQVLEHRRLDPTKGELKLTHYRQGLTLAVRVKNQEFVYCTRKLVHIAHEVFMVFLREGPYYEYRVEKLGLDPDVAWG